MAVVVSIVSFFLLATKFQLWYAERIIATFATSLNVMVGRIAIQPTSNNIMIGEISILPTSNKPALLYEQDSDADLSVYSHLYKKKNQSKSFHKRRKYPIQRNSSVGEYWVVPR